MKVAINGTGRIGLTCARLLGNREDLELCAINSTMSVETLVHLLRYDSVHKNLPNVEILSENEISIGAQKRVRVVSTRDIAQTNFGELGAKLVIECTGKFNSLEASSAHIYGGVERVIISAPAENAPTFVFGVNHTQYSGQKVISNASCTTNALAPICAVLEREFGIESGLMSTIHSYTNDQNLLDSKHKDVRRARAAAMNMIPTSTGAAKAIGLVLPSLAGKLTGFAVRVPTPDVSLVDLSAVLKKKISKQDLLEAFERAACSDFAELIKIDKQKLVSGDFVGDLSSCVIISDCLLAIENHIKIVAWYDNEAGYSARLLDMCKFVVDSI